MARIADLLYGMGTAYNQGGLLGAAAYPWSQQAQLDKSMRAAQEAQAILQKRLSERQGTSATMAPQSWFDAPLKKEFEGQRLEDEKFGLEKERGTAYSDYLKQIGGAQKQTSDIAARQQDLMEYQYVQDPAVKDALRRKLWPEVGMGETGVQGPTPEQQGLMDAIKAWLGGNPPPQKPVVGSPSFIGPTQMEEVKPGVMDKLRSFQMGGPGMFFYVPQAPQMQPRGTEQPKTKGATPPPYLQSTQSTQASPVLPPLTDLAPDQLPGFSQQPTGQPVIARDVLKALADLVNTNGLSRPITAQDLMIFEQLMSGSNQGNR